MAKREFSNIQKILMVIEAIFLLPLIYIISYLCPYQKIYALSKKIGKLLLTKSKREIIQKNLAIIFPDRVFTEAEIRDLGAIIAGYDLRIILEMTAFGRMSFQQKLQYFRFPDPTHFHFDAQYILVTLHFGNWEVLGNFLNEWVAPTGCLVERQFNPWIDKYLQFMRKNLRIPVIYNEISEMKPLFSFLKNHAVALVADQTYWFDPLFIPFFGKEAAVPVGTANLVIKADRPIYYMYTKTIGDGSYEICAEELVTFNLTGNKADDMPHIMQEIYRRFEHTIQNNIHDWYTLGSPRWELTRESLKEWEKNPDSSRY